MVPPLLHNIYFKTTNQNRKRKQMKQLMIYYMPEWILASSLMWVIPKCRVFLKLLYVVAAFVTVTPVQDWWDKVTQKVSMVCAHNTMHKTKSPNDFYNLQSPQQQVSGHIKKKKKKKNYTINQCPPQFCAASSLYLFILWWDCLLDGLVHGSFCF